MQEDNQNREETQASALDSSLSWIDHTKNALVGSWKKLTNLEQTNFQLGLMYMNQGAYRDAAIRFRIVLWMNAKNKVANYMLGKAYVYDNKHAKAIEPLRKSLADDMEMEEAKFFLAICGAGNVPERVPPSLMIENLDVISTIYEEQIANGVNRAAYSIGTKMLNDELENQQGFDILDLDMRTGKSGDFVLPMANNIVGVEPAMRMISQARNRRIDDKLVYNELITKIAQDMLKNDKRQFDIVQAYFSSLMIGGLQELFEMVGQRLGGKKLFLISVEACEGEGFVFNKTSMSFQHSAAYIAKVAEKTGYEIVAQQMVNEKNPNTDLVVLLKKKN